jgi:hypothetical protein
VYSVCEGGELAILARPSNRSFSGRAVPLGFLHQGVKAFFLYPLPSPHPTPFPDCRQYQSQASMEITGGGGNMTATAMGRGWLERQLGCREGVVTVTELTPLKELHSESILSNLPST